MALCIRTRHNSATLWGNGLAVRIVTVCNIVLILEPVNLAGRNVNCIFQKLLQVDSFVEREKLMKYCRYRNYVERPPRFLVSSGRSSRVMIKEQNSVQFVDVQSDLGFSSWKRHTGIILGIVKYFLDIALSSQLNDL